MKRSFIVYFALILTGIATLTGSCSKSGESYCPPSPSTMAPPAEIADVQSYLSGNGITATQHGSGLFYTINAAAGSGSSPVQCSRVSVKYTGRLTNGTVFDQATSPVSFYLYDLIAGWRLSLPLIRTGQTIRMYLPPSLGYGSQQAGSVPPNSILIFDVELVGVQN